MSNPGDNTFQGPSPQTPTNQSSNELVNGAIIFQGLDAAVNLCHNESLNKGWYNDPKTGKPIVRNRAEMLCLIISEITEVLEAERKNTMDDHLPGRRGPEVELADAMIRICDYAGYCGYDIASAFLEKIAYNRTRPDHSLKQRNTENGKKF